MHRIWQIPELLVLIVSYLEANDIDHTFDVSRHFRTLLRANLPPHLRPLPDGRKSPLRKHDLPQDIRDIAQAYIIHETSTPKQLKMEDTYYHWREDARSQILAAVSPHLHPVLAKYTTCLTDGYASLAAGDMNIVLQTHIPYHTLYTLIHGTEQEHADTDANAYLAIVPPKRVTVFCLGGAQWDLLYADVGYRGQGGVQRFCVTAERERGVRMQDVMQELRGTLVKEGMGGGLGQDVGLVWVFGG